MNARRDYTDFLRDILEYAEKAAHFVEDVPWEDVVGMRSKLIHDYFGGDLIVALNRLLSETEAGDWVGQVRWLNQWRTSC